MRVSLRNKLVALFCVLVVIVGAVTLTWIERTLADDLLSALDKRLSDQGLIEHAPYKGVVLAASGRSVALRMLRRHRIIEHPQLQRQPDHPQVQRRQRQRRRQVR